MYAYGTQKFIAVLDGDLSNYFLKQLIFFKIKEKSFHIQCYMNQVLVLVHSLTRTHTQRQRQREGGGV